MPNPKTAGLPNPAAYDTNTPDVVIDTTTNLMWQKSITQPVDTTTWYDAKLYCEALTLGGFDWRLPTRVELVSIVDFTKENPAIDDAFPATPQGYYWSSSLWINLASVWYVHSKQGAAHAGSPSLTRNVRCVRSISETACTPPPERYTIPMPDDGTVFDTKTKLTWQRDFGPSTNWAQATSDCANRGSGWRLPSVKELQTLVDESQKNPASDKITFMYPTYAECTQACGFWTSSPSTPNAWSVDFLYGYTVNTTASNDVRCVRSGP
jgi:hypothetical protein